MMRDTSQFLGSTRSEEKHSINKGTSGSNKDYEEKAVLE